MRSVDHDGFDEVVVLLCLVILWMVERHRQLCDELEQAQAMGQKHYEDWLKEQSLRDHCKRCYGDLDRD